MVENLYEKVKSVLVNEWDKVAVDAGEVLGHTKMTLRDTWIECMEYQ